MAGEPPPVRWQVGDVPNGPKLAAASFHVSGSVCGGGSAEGCVAPSSGGFLVRGTGRLLGFTARDISRAGYSPTEDRPERICVRLVVSTGACESRNNGEGTLTVVGPGLDGKYGPLETVATRKGARTMALDAKTHRVFLVTAEFGPAPEATAEQPHPRPVVKPGTFTLLVFGR